jgi:4-amino-4-deoxy-L-arabinose transferase-like glycosyltransferase
MDANSRRYAALLLAAAAAGLALRLAFGFGYWTGEVLTRDEREYLSLARGVASGRGFVYDADVLDDPGEPFGRAPGYPAFLAAVGGGRAGVAAVPGSVKAAQAVLGAAGVVLVGLLATRLGGRRAGVAAAAIAAAYPPLVWISAYAFSEALFWPLGLLLAMSATRMLDPDRAAPARAALWCGLLAGVCVLIRPGTLVVAPLAAVVLTRQRRLAPLAVFALGLAVVVAPWTARNYAQSERFVLVASEGGVTFWTGNNPLARGEGDFAANPDIRRASDALRARHPGLSEEDMEPIYYREALRWIAAHPLDWLALEASKLFYLVVPIGPSYRLHSARYYAASVVSYGLVLVGAIVGLSRVGRRAARVPGLWLLAASAVAIGLVFFPQERFRIPILDPTLVICTGAVWSRRGTDRS